MKERSIRRTQTISPFGVGAIVDMLGESFVSEDISRWRGKRSVLRAPRIAAHFGVQELRTPPPLEEKGSGLPYYRFPQWLFCGSCRRLERWSVMKEEPGKPPRCGVCSGRPQLVPMRFVAVCGKGHLDDVDWNHWAHSDPKKREQRQCGQRNLRFRHVSGVGGGLESVEVGCECGARRNLKDLPGADSMKKVGVRCRGRQPWQFDNEAEKCDQHPAVLQRGAASVYFSLVRSALDIPPDSDWLQWSGPASRIRNNPNFQLLESNPEHVLAEQLLSMTAQDEQVTVAQVRMVLADRVGLAAGPAVVAEQQSQDIESGEWTALTGPPAKHDPRDNFISKATPFPQPTGHAELQPVADELAKVLRQVVLVDRLREVRVLTGFQRHTMDRQVPPDLGKGEKFLPAIEIFGEGVFLQFDESEVARWEAGPEVRRRAELLRDRLSGSMQAKWIEAEVSPRLIMLHTFAHVLMRAMAFEAGYSSSSLRERLYSAAGETPRVGVLIYTAAGDSEGTMGGLARLGTAERLLPIMASAIGAAEWCSLDPVCRESESQGVGGLSMAACHACSLASETSCVLGNVLLDRVTLLDSGFGFLAPVLGALLDVQAGSAG